MNSVIFVSQVSLTSVIYVERNSELLVVKNAKNVKFAITISEYKICLYHLPHGCYHYIIMNFSG